MGSCLQHKLELCLRSFPLFLLEIRQREVEASEDEVGFVVYHLEELIQTWRPKTSTSCNTPVRCGIAASPVRRPKILRIRLIVSPDQLLPTSLLSGCTAGGKNAVEVSF